MINPNDPAGTIVAVLQETGKNQSSLAKAIGVNRSTIGRWKSGKKLPDDAISKLKSLLETAPKKHAQNADVASPSPPEIRDIPVLEIFDDDEIQQRATKVEAAVVQEYTEAMTAGAEFPPVVVFEYDEGAGFKFLLADGFHRLKASIEARRETISAIVKTGSRRDALLYAVGANATHGKQRTNADKRQAVQTLLNDEEWREWSDGRLSKLAGVSDRFVSKMRAEIYATHESREPTPIKQETINARNTTPNGSESASPKGRGTTPNGSELSQPEEARTRKYMKGGKEQVMRVPGSKSSKKPRTQPAEKAIKRYSESCIEVRKANLSKSEMFKVCANAEATIRHYLRDLADKEADTIRAKLADLAGQIQ